MNIYKIERKDACNYDQYDSAIVAAMSPKDAKTIHPAGEVEVVLETAIEQSGWDSWTTQDNIDVTFIGKAGVNVKRGVILASYNAG